MEIKNKNICLNLNEGEEIVYIAEKSTSSFYFFILFPIFLASYFIYLPIKYVFVKFNLMLILQNPHVTWSLLGCCLIILFSAYIIYSYIEDYFFTDIIITTQRFIILTFNKPTFIDYEDINYISNSGYKGPAGVFIKTLKKNFTVYFVDWKIIKSKVQKIDSSKDFNEPKMTKKDVFIVLVIVILFISAKIFLHW
jgi:hypothetical protein